MNFSDFKWINESRANVKGNQCTVYAPAETDFFFNNEASVSGGIIPESLCNAPFYYTNVCGDFVLNVVVSHEFKYTYDSASVMVMLDMKNWAKSCFELTDFGTRAVVSVVARNGETDDANGCNIECESVWLRISRKGSVFAFHYSTDGKEYYMSRVFSLPVGDCVKVGLLAQSPTGEGGDRIYSDLSIEQKTVANIRFA